MCKSKDCKHKSKFPMSVTHPHLAKEIVGVDPSTLYAWKGKKFNWICKKHGHIYESAGCHREAGSGCNICCGKKILVGFNDMATTHKNLAKELIGDPTTHIAGTPIILKWKCSKGHIFPARGSDRVNGKNCPYCSNKKVLPGFNDMQTTHKDLAREYLGDPTKVIAGTAALLEWVCVNGHWWEATGNSRTSNKSGCPTCSKTGFKLGMPSFFYLICKKDRLKFGIANHNSRRLQIHGRSGWKLIEAIDMVGYVADALEKKVKGSFKTKGIPLGQFSESFDGRTESWRRSDLSVRTIRGLCRKLRINLNAFLAM